MNGRARLAAALALAALAGCTSSTTTSATALLADPTSVAVFRGVTLKSGVSPYRPFIAVANATTNDVTILDAIDDSLLPAPAPTRSLGYPVPGRPLLLAAADLGDDRPDLLVVATAGDLPWLGGTQLRVLRTWRADGAVVDRADGAPAVDFGADILAVLALPPEPRDPANPNAPRRVKLVAALAGERVGTVTFTRATSGDVDAQGAFVGIDVEAAQATVAVSAPLGFQPLGLAALAGERTRVFAASSDALPGGVLGVAEIDVSGTPTFTAALNAHAPTRLVAAAHLPGGEASLWSAADGSTPKDATAFPGAPVDRILAVLDESGCGVAHAIGCGLVGIDPATRDLVLDPTPAGTFHAPFRAPIVVPKDPPAAATPYPTALGFLGPPVAPPSTAEPQYAGTFMRVQMAANTWSTTGVAALASSDAFVTFVDVGRWMVPTNQRVFDAVKAIFSSTSSTRPSAATPGQYLTVAASDGRPVGHADASGLSTAVQVTGGYTPTDVWTVVREGELPGLASRRAEAYADGSFALQVSDPALGTVREVARVWDPSVGVSTGDIVVIEPTGLGTCKTFEATITAVNPPSAAVTTTTPPLPAHPGGSLVLGYRTPTNAGWNQCFDLMKADAQKTDPTQRATYLATVRAAGYVLLRGLGAAALHVGRPVVGERFEVAWRAEEPLVAACSLPPAVPWQSAWSGSATTPPAPPACDDACRSACMDLQRVRLARRVLYVEDGPAGLGGPALAFTLALESPTAIAPGDRDLALTFTTVDGRAPYRVTPSGGYPTYPRAVVPFDRTPWAAAGGPSVLVPYAGGVLLDVTPTVATNGMDTIH